MEKELEILKPKKALITFPNFDDVDLGVVVLGIIGVTSLICAVILISALHAAGATSKELVPLIPVVLTPIGLCVAGISGMVKGTKRQPNDKA